VSALAVRNRELESISSEKMMMSPLPAPTLSKPFFRASAEAPRKLLL